MPAVTAGPWTLRLGPSVAELAQLYPWMTAIAAATAMPQTTLDAVRVVLEEAVSNIARHGLPPGGHGHIDIMFRGDAAGWTLELRDDGPAFDPTAAPARAKKINLLDDDVGGWGLGLIRHFCTDMAYARVEGFNVLTLLFAGEGKEGSVLF